MKQTFIALFVLIIVGLLAALVSIKTEERTDSDIVVETESLIVEHRVEMKGENIAKHTYTGVVSVPTPCHTLTTSVEVAESYPEQIFLNIFSIQNEGEMCAQVISEADFEVAVEASKDASLSGVMLNGANVDFTVDEL